MQIYDIELEVWLGLVAVVGAAVLWALKKYRQVNADGKITLDEIINVVEEGEGHAEDCQSEGLLGSPCRRSPASCSSGPLPVVSTSLFGRQAPLGRCARPWRAGVYALRGAARVPKQ